MAQKDKLRLALMRGVPRKWDMKANFEVFLEMSRKASGEGADIFVTPECWLDGYAAPESASTPGRLKEVAQDARKSEFLQGAAETAWTGRMWVCFGFVSLEDGGAVGNAAGLWNREGKLMGVYLKTHLQTHDVQFRAGNDLPAWETEFGKIGIMICADRRWPETARTLRLKGARLILNPSYGMCHEANEWWMRTKGYENQCFIAFVHPKVGFVVNPSGNLAAKGEGADPGILICDVDLSEARDDNHIRDRRPELYGIIAEMPGKPKP
ncbi:MAG TPA: carbon-nitrogen hydrolase family protein [Candidatus Brocadiia bacterium]|nr:carbon-nitrogen hydrolase family protein [Candidatus Brocadiia bacterium]